MSKGVKILSRQMPEALEEAAKQAGLEPEPVVNEDGIKRYRVAGTRRRQGADMVLKKTIEEIFSEAIASTNALCRYSYRHRICDL